MTEKRQRRHVVSLYLIPQPLDNIGHLLLDTKEIHTTRALAPPHPSFLNMIREQKIILEPTSTASALCRYPLSLTSPLSIILVIFNLNSLSSCSFGPSQISSLGRGRISGWEGVISPRSRASAAARAAWRWLKVWLSSWLHCWVWT